MTKEVFEKIAAGLNEAIQIARGEIAPLSRAGSTRSTSASKQGSASQQNDHARILAKASKK